MQIINRSATAIESASGNKESVTAPVTNAPPRAQLDVTESGLRRILIVASVMAAALMQTLDSTITNVALPTVQGNLGASQDEGKRGQQKCTAVSDYIGIRERIEEGCKV